jgi:hypothetical protein
VADGLAYHALNRGNHRGLVFTADGDLQASLRALAQTPGRYPFRLYGYRPLTNHFHLLLAPRARAVDQPHPAVADRGAHLALPPSTRHGGPWLPRTLQKPRHSVR